MRLWSLDPALLDRQGLTACRREALLAQAVRSSAHRASVATAGSPAAHPLFVVVPGGVASWERAS